MTKQKENLTDSKPMELSPMLGEVPAWELHQEHDEEIKRVMEQTGCSFRKWNGKVFWELAKEYGHTSLDFMKCGCRHFAQRIAYIRSAN